MEIREYARTILESGGLDAKLAPPARSLEDRTPGAPLILGLPARDPDIRIRPGREVKVPAREGMCDPAQRIRIIHAFANHELQAVELFAWALLAFPDAAPEFRRGLVRILADEQRHTRMYLKLLSRRSAAFGDFPVSGYFWAKAGEWSSPLRFIAAMSLTFECANLDHASDYGGLARKAGDRELADVIEVVHREEIEHVRFGWTWLNRLKAEGETAWEAYRRSLVWPLRPSRSVGRQFDELARTMAGMEPSFLEALGRETD
ncbi:MAG: DUF455 family protein [Acidobacteria bacterium]|uniref:DUF455 family protein n=1 Tax=Candidatus Polarisedimenticola svalbardensis TaxID=2886004 RepID=A0A8J7CFA3_9BACT|nr:DUF455 family protein [Candidatus Polarisedimenticola svalbardensis]